MKKQLLSGLLAALLIGTTLTGCSAKKDSGSQDSSSAGSSSGGSVTVYSPNATDEINETVKEFQEKTGIQVNLVAAGTGELLKRIQAESSNPLGDIMWGGGADSLAAYSDYFQEFVPTEVSKFSEGYVDSGSKWTGTSPLPMVIMYNKKLVSESDAPKSWADLTDPKWKGKIAYADPTASGSAYTILCTMLTAYGKDNGQGWDFIKKFVANLDGKVMSSSSDVPKKVDDGEYSVGLTLEKQAVLYMNSNPSDAMVYPSEGTSTVPDALAIIKDCKNKANAEAFANFVCSQDTQSMLVSKYNIRPVRSDVTLPQSLSALKDIKLVDYDFNWASSSKSTILDQWKQILVG